MGTRERRFVNRVAIITGSARGMGKQLALDMAVEGARVVLTDIDGDALATAAREVRDAGGECLSLQADVSKSAEVRDLVDSVIREWATVDVLVNNAGYLTTGDIEDMSDELIDKTLKVNVYGVLYLVRTIAPIMKEKRSGKIINVASITAKNGDSSTIPVYGSSKGALVTLTRSIARELGPYNINCNCIAPHAVMTEMMSYWDESRKQRARDLIPLRRLGSVEDMSNLMMFLASEESSFITGEAININGGYYMD